MRLRCLVTIWLLLLTPNQSQKCFIKRFFYTARPKSIRFSSSVAEEWYTDWKIVVPVLPVIDDSKLKRLNSVILPTGSCQCSVRDAVGSMVSQNIGSLIVTDEARVGQEIGRTGCSPQHTARKLPYPHRPRQFHHGPKIMCLHSTTTHSWVSIHFKS
jgi:hypothetical protein